MQRGDDRRTDDTRRVYVALPVIAADHPALAELKAALKDFILPLGINLSQHQRGGPADRGVAGGVGAVFRQRILFLGVTGGDAIKRKWANAHVLLLRSSRRQVAGIFNHVGEQLVQLRRIFGGNGRAEGAGEGVGDAAAAQVGVFNRQLTALGAAQQTAFLIHRLIV